MRPKKKILYIEDNADSLELVRQAMDIGGYDFLGAADGQTGLALAQSTCPDLILLDISLPDMDGYELIRRLRADFQNIPIWAITALAAKEDQEKALHAGCNHYVTKPVDVSELWRTVAACFPD
jgi:CheY-like chemotaxis protein